MKKILLFSVLLLIVCAASAQTKFSVPVPTMEQKYNLAQAFMYNNVLVGINVAKSAGMTAEEYSKKCGAVFAPAWNKDMGFDQFVNTVLYHWSCLSDSLKIIEQSDEKVVFTVQHIYPQLENQGVLLGTSFEELVQHWDIVYGAIADYLNLNCKTTKVQKGVEVSITQ
jgi:hypothetical protein